MSTEPDDAPETVRALVRDLLSAARLGQGPIRPEDRSQRTTRQLWAYEQLRLGARVGAGS